MILLVSGFLIWVGAIVDQNQLQPLLSKALGSKYRVEMRSANISLLNRAIYAGGITILSAPDDQPILETDTISLSGIGLGAIFGKNFSIDILQVNDFTLNWDYSLLQEDNDTSQSPSTQKLAIQAVDLKNGTVKIIKNRQESSRYNDVSLKAGFEYNFRNSAEDSSRQKSRIKVDTLGLLFSEDRYRLAVSGLNFRQEDGFVSLSSMKLKPVGGYDQFMATLEYATNMFDIEVDDLKASGIDSKAFSKDKQINADLIEFGSFNIHVAKNKQIPEDPNKEKPQLLHKSIQQLPYDIQLDSLTFKHTNIQYSEQDEDGARPGTISFMNSTIYINNVDSRSSSPSILRAATYLENHSQLNTELTFTLNDGPFHMTGTGDLKTFDLTQLNSIFTDLEGIEIKSGNLHELNFEFEMKDDTSSGKMYLIYENLTIKPVDKDEHEGSFMKSVRGFFVNDLALRSENMADRNDEVKTGEIKYERDPDDSFFKYLWQTLRSGIFDIALRV